MRQCLTDLWLKSGQTVTDPRETFQAVVATRDCAVVPFTLYFTLLYCCLCSLLPIVVSLTEALARIPLAEGPAIQKAGSLSVVVYLQANQAYIHISRL